MSDLTQPRRDASPAQHDGARGTMSPDGPLRPEAGSALEHLLGRHAHLLRGGLLGFVPAQVR